MNGEIIKSGNFEILDTLKSFSFHHRDRFSKIIINTDSYLNYPETGPIIRFAHKPQPENKKTLFLLSFSWDGLEIKLISKSTGSLAGKSLVRINDILSSDTEFGNCIGAAANESLLFLGFEKKIVSLNLQTGQQNIEYHCEPDKLIKDITCIKDNLYMLISSKNLIAETDLLLHFHQPRHGTEKSLNICLKEIYTFSFSKINVIQGLKNGQILIGIDQTRIQNLKWKIFDPVSGNFWNLLPEDTLQNDLYNKLSNVVNGESYALTGQKSLIIIDGQKRPNKLIKIPEFCKETVSYHKFPYSILSPDLKSVIFWSPDRVMKLEIESETIDYLFMPEMGSILNISFLNKKSILAIREHRSSFEPLSINLNKNKIESKLPNFFPIEPFPQTGWSVNAKGFLILSRKNGEIQIFKENFTECEIEKTGFGPIRELFCHCSDDETMCAVSFSSAILSKSKNSTWKIFKNSYPGMRFCRPSYAHSKSDTELYLNSYPLGFLMIPLGNRTFLCRSYKNLEIHFFDGLESQVLAKINLKTQILSAYPFENKILVILEDNYGFIFDPLKFFDEGDFSGETLKFDFDLQKWWGITGINSEMLCLHNSHGIHLARISNKTVVGEKYLALPGITNVKFDHAHQWLLISFKHWLGIYSLDLEEKARLYLLQDNNFFIQAFSPDSNIGYFYSNGPEQFFYLCLCPLNEKNEVLRWTEVSKKYFRENYLSKFLVKCSFEKTEGISHQISSLETKLLDFKEN